MCTPDITAVFIGLGSNLNHPESQLQRAIKALAKLPQTQLVVLSCVYRSRPIGPVQQPDFLNAVALLHTALKPMALLDRLQEIETQQQRIRNVHWGPRTIDLDILLYGDQEIYTERLAVPHPRLSERNFVLRPLLDINPHLALPGGVRLSQLAAAVGNEGLEVFATADSFYPTASA